MAAGYIISKIEELGDKQIDGMIPHEYVEGKEHGKRHGGGWIYDQRIDAGGLEGQLEELKDRFHQYLSERYDALQNEFDRLAPRAVYMLDKSTEDEPHMDFVFTDKTALQAVRLRHFLNDCRALLSSDPTPLGRTVEREEQSIARFLSDNHQDILQNFDPGVVKFRKKRKIVIADGALDGLL